jgi:aerobic-type carbon monoxide dehydrogenase small subunit (CoxS/CutS family)
MLDGTTFYSCSTLTHAVRNRQLVTIEGLRGPNGELHPVQQAFVEELAPQCGFCTPGQVVAAVALLQKNPTPTREEARQAMAGNLCRCGAYDNYLNGIMRAAGNTAEIHHGV